MNSKDMGADVVLAWPTAAVAVMGAEGAANIVFRKEIQSSPNPEETRRRKIEEYRQAFDNPYVAAARGYIDDIISPEHTRAVLFRHLEMLWTKKEERPFKKHDNIPL
jgi:acetyl-CoA carboxylase carboxyltransferase component